MTTALWQASGLRFLTEVIFNILQIPMAVERPRLLSGTLGPRDLQATDRRNPTGVRSQVAATGGGAQNSGTHTSRLPLWHTAGIKDAWRLTSRWGNLDSKLYTCENKVELETNGRKQKWPERPELTKITMKYWRISFALWFNTYFDGVAMNCWIGGSLECFKEKLKKR